MTHIIYYFINLKPAGVEAYRAQYEVCYRLNRSCETCMPLWRKDLPIGIRYSPIAGQGAPGHNIYETRIVHRCDLDGSKVNTVALTN